MPKIEDNPPRIELIATGGQTVFDFEFWIRAKEDLVVTVDGTVKTLGTDYTINDAGVQNNDGGTVTFASGLTLNDSVVMYRDTSLARQDEYSEGGAGAFTGEGLNLGFNTVFSLLQELANGFLRSVRLSPSSTYSGELTLPDADAGKALRWNDDGDGLVNSTNNFDDIVTDATTQATAAAASASAASTSASNASTSAGNAATSATNASNSASAASTSATNAATSATAAAGSATTASGHATTATTQASNAATSATNASNSASAASTSATTASGHATTATTQASNAATSATNASNSASAASTSATNAATSETNAAASAAAAAASAGTLTYGSVAEALTGTATNRIVSPDTMAALWEAGSNIASASSLAIPSTGGGYFQVTGTTTITAINQAAALRAGREIELRFAGILTLTHNATSLILPTGASITTAAGDIARFRCEDATNNYWRCVGYHRASGQPLVAASLASIAEVITGTDSVRLQQQIVLLRCGKPVLILPRHQR